MLAFLLLTYLVAAVPFGVVLTTLWGGDEDVRTSGSGNIGATNVARVFGWKIAAPVLALDMLKGLLPVLAARLLWSDMATWWLGLVALVAFAGHCWPVYLEFRGGKGVATGAGAMLGIVPGPTVGAMLVWGAVLAATGMSSAAALLATVALVALCWAFEPASVDIAVVALAAGIVVRHVANIERLILGEEGEMVRPVRWRRSTAPATAADVLNQDPSGGAAPEPLWKEKAEDPLDAGDKA